MKKLMLGNMAIARGAYEAGASVVSSYPGTPSTEITENIAKYDEIYSEWATNEKVATEVAVGASIVGARSMTCMKHVGLNVAADPLFTASYTGVGGGLVLVVADDPGMHSSQNEQDSRNYAKAAKLPMLEPADSGDCKEFVKLAYDISEKYDTPVIVRLTTRVAHSQSLVAEEERIEKPLGTYEKNIGKNVMMPAMARGRHVYVEKRMAELAEFADNSDINAIEYNDKKIGIIASGIAYQYAKEAMPEASFLKIGMVHPLPMGKIKEFAKNVDKLYVVEELDPFIEEACKVNGVDVIGKDVFTLLGEYTPELIKAGIMGEKYEEKQPSGIPVRPPVMCPGCPHRGVFHVLKKLGLTVSGDIGCYTLGAAAPLASIDVCVCMGASVSGLHGMTKARGEEFSKKSVAVIGDSTFMHSGITGLIDIVYNKGNATVIILDNAITGMTGHQQNPTTGYTIKGEETRRVDIEMLAKAIGVNRVTVADPFEVDEFEKVVKAELEAAEPSVIIARRPCALLKHVNYGAPCKVDADKCKGCKMCMKIGCPAITFKDGKAIIDPSQCNGCGLCTKICKFGAIGKQEA
ncbi:MAG: indolepyruvate ferredoxin oxidoreductase subunit alpha [Clostridia bacterium]|nr:indolepyruvate ferredoxin oxidoreductase subunit alpha [Clostridia bacterium]